MSSKNLSNRRAGSRRGAKAPKAAPGTTDLDRPLKLASAQALASAGLYVRTNVVLSEPRSATTAGKWVTDITDVDVMGIIHTLDLRADTSCVTCKGGVSVSVLHETFALAGVMRYLRAQRGYGVFVQKATEPHMVALAEQLDIAVMDEPEWTHWRRRVAGPRPVPRTFEDRIDEVLGDQLSRRTDLTELLSYLRAEFWYFRDYRNVQNLIGQLRRVAGQLRPEPIPAFVVLDACGQFALAVLQLCERVSASGVMRLTDTVPPYLFGGISTYRNRRDLLRRVEEFMRRKEVLDTAQSMPSLDPAYVPELCELVLRFCNKPAAAGRVPQYLNFCAGEVAAQVAGERSVSRAHGEDDLTEKLAFDLLDFVGKAARINPDLIRALQGSATALATGGRPGGAGGAEGREHRSTATIGTAPEESHSRAAGPQRSLLEVPEEPPSRS